MKSKTTGKVTDNSANRLRQDMADEKSWLFRQERQYTSFEDKVISDYKANEHNRESIIIKLIQLHHFHPSYLFALIDLKPSEHPEIWTLAIAEYNRVREVFSNCFTTKR